MQVTLNGESRDIRPGCTVAALLADLGINPKTVVAQINDDIAERSAFETTLINDGDTVELIRFVGGG